MAPPSRRQQVAVDLTALLDEARFPRRSPVFWHESYGSFVVLAPSLDPESATGEDLLWLGATPASARRWALRKRWEAREPSRRAAHQKALGVLDILRTLPGDLLRQLVGR
jgi:hypothetical protein